MRISLLASARTSAVLSVVLALPLLAQSVPLVTRLIVVGKGTNRIEVRCKDAKDLKQCVDEMQGRSPKEMERLKGLAPKLQQQLKEELSKTQDRSGRCFALRVYEYPKGFPEKNGNAGAKVSDCTSAALVKEKTPGLHAKAGRSAPQP